MIFYAVTDPSTLDFKHLDADLERIAHKASMIVYRDKYNADYASQAKTFIDHARKFGFDKVVLHGDVELAERYNAHGVHLRSDQFGQISTAKSKGLFVIVSTHSTQEAKEAQALGSDMVTFSPIFETPNKGKPVGLEALREVVHSVSIPVIALGGILNDEQIKACKEAGASGIASIRYFA
ncbi:MAG: thiamine phosphate synthase [Campylobacterales bacterium]|nr:thiamine phosphate synthase [Campylobacterales bacterium]